MTIGRFACDTTRSIDVDGVDAANPSLKRVGNMDVGNHGLLVRDGHIAADQFSVGDPGDEIRKFLWWNRYPVVGACDAQDPQPVTVDQRRPRVPDRPADDARPFHRFASAAWRRRKASNGSKGKPNMVK
jgi:hypothetical protein